MARRSARALAKHCSIWISSVELSWRSPEEKKTDVVVVVDFCTELFFLPLLLLLLLSARPLSVVEREFINRLHLYMYVVTPAAGCCWYGKDVGGEREKAKECQVSSTGITSDGMIEASCFL